MPSCYKINEKENDREQNGLNDMTPGRGNRENAQKSKRLSDLEVGRLLKGKDWGPTKGKNRSGSLYRELFTEDCSIERNSNRRGEVAQNRGGVGSSALGRTLKKFTICFRNPLEIKSQVKT